LIVKPLLIDTDPGLLEKGSRAGPWISMPLGTEVVEAIPVSGGRAFLVFQQDVPAEEPTDVPGRVRAAVSP
jgi:hypothetical protein